MKFFSTGLDDSFIFSERAELGWNRLEWKRRVSTAIIANIFILHIFRTDHMAVGG
jgi:hypothetical protein